MYLIKLKFEAFDAIKSFVKIERNQFGQKVKIIRFDNALEFDDYNCKDFFNRLELCTKLPVLIGATKWKSGQKTQKYT